MKLKGPTLAIVFPQGGSPAVVSSECTQADATAIYARQPATWQDVINQAERAHAKLTPSDRDTRDLETLDVPAIVIAFQHGTGPFVHSPPREEADRILIALPARWQRVCALIQRALRMGS